jgi:mRNA interferase RelE/StbE
VSYRVDMQSPAQRDFDGLPVDMQKQVAKHLRALAEDPRPPGAIRVQDAPKGSYRIRVGEYRVGYRVDDGTRVVSIWGIGPRGTFYKMAGRRRR